MECNTGVVLQGWPQNPIRPPFLNYSIEYEEQTRTITLTALKDLVPDPPLEPGIKQIHLMLLDFVNPRPGEYRVSVTAETGPGGAFIASDHTLRHFRTGLADPHLVSRHGSWGAWQAAGSPDMLSDARETVRRTLAEHRPVPLPGEIIEQLDQIQRESS